MNIDQITKAIEVYAGESIEGLRESLAEMKAGKLRVSTPQKNSYCALHAKRWSFHNQNLQA